MLFGIDEVDRYLGTHKPPASATDGIDWGQRVKFYNSLSSGTKYKDRSIEAGSV